MRTLDRRQAEFIVGTGDSIVPGVRSLNAPAKERFTEIIDEFLSARPVSLQRQFKIFLVLLRYSSLIPYLKPLDKLNEAQKESVLDKFENSCLSLLRLGFWGLKTMVFMGYYGQEEIGRRINYTPSLTGNEELHGT